MKVEAGQHYVKKNEWTEQVHVLTLRKMFEKIVATAKEVGVPLQRLHRSETGGACTVL
jgi:hypothetical protein